MESLEKEERKGVDFILYLPKGTMCYDTSSRFLKELNSKWCVLKGGKGGKGNHFFKTASLQAPQISQPGESSVQRKLVLELKWRSDVCCIGLRNSGKTSLVLKLAKRKETIYPSSYPRLVSIEPSQLSPPLLFVDLPGLSPSTRRFLKQAERTKLIMFVIYLSDNNTLSSYQKLREELFSYDQKQKSNLSQKKSLLLLIGKKDQEGVKKLRFFDKEPINKICFFSLNDLEKLNQLKEEIIKTI